VPFLTVYPEASFVNKGLEGLGSKNNCQDGYSLHIDRLKDSIVIDTGIQKKVVQSLKFERFFDTKQRPQDSGPLL